MSDLPPPKTQPIISTNKRVIEVAATIVATTLLVFCTVALAGATVWIVRFILAG